jgi:hypothetical protein
MRKDRSGRSKFAALTVALTVALAAAMVLSSAAPAAADAYDSKRSGHPLRILAYIVHPVGVILDRLIFRPFYWIGSQEPVKTVVGQKDE